MDNSIEEMSVSELIRNNSESLVQERNEVSSFVESISNGKSIPIDADWNMLRKEYIEYLEQKYQ